MNFTGHVTVSLMIFVLISFAWWGLGLSTALLIPGLPLFMLGALLPDIDSKVSIPHKYFMKFVLVLGFIACLIAFNNILALFSLFFSPASSVLFSALTVFVLPYTLRKLVRRIIPSHRGFMHSTSMALIYGGIIFFLTNSLGLFILSTAGWLTHKLLDA